MLTEHADRIGAIKRKSADHKIIQALERDQVQAFISATDPTTLMGARDQALLALLYNTGARVQEFVDLEVADLRLDAPTQVLLTGKAHKQRLVPLWPNTVKALEHYLDWRRRNGVEHPRLFLNARGQPFARWGINCLAEKYRQRAAHPCPSLATQHVTPHTFRHTTALHLIQSGVDLSTVQEWLGHAHHQTTHEYAYINMDMKRQALESCPAPQAPSTPPPQEPEWIDPDTLNFLDDLTRPRTLCEATSCPTASAAAD